MPTILGRNYEIIEHPILKNRFVVVVREEFIVLRRTYLEFTDHTHMAVRWNLSPTRAVSGSSVGGLEKALAHYHDKPKMTPEERKAALVACGWDA